MNDPEYKAEAEENLTQSERSAGFTLKDKTEFYRKKWLKEHIAVMIVIGICLAGVLAAGILIKNPWLVSAAPLLLAAAHIWRHNAMMAYVERNAYDGTVN